MEIKLDALDRQLGQLVEDFGIGAILTSLGRLQAVETNSFPKRLSEVFAEMNLEGGAKNCVPLLKIRQALPHIPPALFQQELLKLCPHLYQLVPMPPLYALSDEEAQAVIHARGEYYLSLAKVKTAIPTRATVAAPPSRRIAPVTQQEINIGSIGNGTSWEEAPTTK